MAGQNAQMQSATIEGLFEALRTNFVNSQYFQEVIAQTHRKHPPYVTIEHRGKQAKWTLHFKNHQPHCSFSWQIEFHDRTLGSWMARWSPQGILQLLYKADGQRHFDDFSGLADEHFAEVFAALQRAMMAYISLRRLSTARWYTHLLR